MTRDPLAEVRRAAERVLKSNYPGCETYLEGKKAVALARLVRAILGQELALGFDSDCDCGTCTAIARCAEEIRGDQ
jgi:hypothetical protein